MLRAYILTAKMWTDDMDIIIQDRILECACRAAFPSTPNAKVAPRPPIMDPQAHVRIDVVNLDFKDFLYIVDECTSWSEAVCLPRRDMHTKIAASRRIEHLRHGPKDYTIRPGVQQRSVQVFL